MGKRVKMIKDFEVEALSNEVAEKYNALNDERALNNLRLVITRLVVAVLGAKDFAKAKGIEAIREGEKTIIRRDRGKCLRVLDMGCGSTEAEKPFRKPEQERQFEPWLCRTLHHLGQKPIGIDIHMPNHGEKEAWEFYQMDLSYPGELMELSKMVPDHCVDIVNIDRLVPASDEDRVNLSPTYSSLIVQSALKMQMMHRAVEDPIKLEKIVNVILKCLHFEAFRVVKSHGLLLINNHRYLKKPGMDDWNYQKSEPIFPPEELEKNRV